MFTRRNLLLGTMASVVALPAQADKVKTKKKFKLNPIYLPQMVKFSGYPSGTIVVDPESHFLYLVYSRGRARRYGVGVGKAGLKFKGTARIGRKSVTKPANRLAASLWIPKSFSSIWFKRTAKPFAMAWVWGEKGLHGRAMQELAGNRNGRNGHRLMR